MAIHSSFLPGKSHGQRSLVGYSPWGCKESDMTEKPALLTIFTLNEKSIILSLQPFIYTLKVKLLSRVLLFATPWTVAYQAPLSMGFSRQEYWSGLPFPSPGDLLDPGFEPGLPH